jgi:FkbM family methyltransferase
MGMHHRNHELQRLHDHKTAVTFQRILIKLLASGALIALGRRLLRRRVWRIETGAAAGLKIGFPQNFDYILGSSEVPVQQCLLEHLVPGDVFYDVGANVGFFSLLAARRVGGTGAVYSFEPVSENAAAVRRNVSLNKLAGVGVFEVAVADKSGMGRLCLTNWDGGCSLAADGMTIPEAVEQRAVQTVALDDFIEFEQLRPPTVVKIDVEGAELGVLTGMLKLIVRFKPVLLYEVDDRDSSLFHRRWKDLDDFVEALGYKVTHLEKSYPNLKWHVGHSLAVPINGDPR